MNLENAQEIIEFYKIEKKYVDKFTPDELCLFFYFAAYYREDLSRFKEFEEILT